MPNYTERTVLSKPRDFDQVANNAGSGGVVNNNVTETINNVTVNGSAVSIFNQLGFMQLRSLAFYSFLHSSSNFSRLNFHYCHDLGPFR